MVVDALGLPLTFEITEGQRHDSRPAKALIARVLSRSPRELVGQMAPSTRQRLDDAARENQEVQRQVVNVQPFVIEHHGNPVGSSALGVANFPGTGTGAGTGTGTGRLGVDEYEDTP